MEPLPQPHLPGKFVWFEHASPDVPAARRFYEALLGDYFDGNRTILVTTHQVEEIERILTHLMFINHGRVVLDASMDDIAKRYAELLAPAANVEAARALRPLSEREVFGKKLFLFEGVAREQLRSLGEVHTPSVADLFVAKMKGVAA